MKKIIIPFIILTALVFSLSACKKEISETLYGVIEYEYRGSETFVFMVMPLTNYDRLLLEQVETGKEFYTDGDVVKLTFDEAVVTRFYNDFAYLNTYPIAHSVLGKGVKAVAEEKDFAVTIPIEKVNGSGETLRIVCGEKTLSFSVTSANADSVTVKVPRSSFNAFFANYENEFILA